MQKTRKILSIMIAVIMVIGVLPSVAFAEESTTALPIIGNDGVAYATVAEAITGAGDATEINITLAGQGILPNCILNRMILL